MMLSNNMTPLDQRQTNASIINVQDSTIAPTLPIGDILSLLTNSQAWIRSV